jgi:hypothetical protein
MGEFICGLSNIVSGLLPGHDVATQYMALTAEVIAKLFIEIN